MCRRLFDDFRGGRGHPTRVEEGSRKGREEIKGGISCRRGAQGAASNEYFVAPLGAIPEDGMPRRFEIVSDRVDAWSFIPGQAIGAIFLSRQKVEPGQPEVVAFHATCPHAGCTVAFNVDTNAFLCPCHNSSFDKDGKKMDLSGRSNPSPRGLDKLEVNQDKLARDGEVWVKYLNYYTGRKDMKPKI